MAGFANNPGSALISTLTWDTNMVVPAGKTIHVDHIAETTPGNGIIADSSNSNWGFNPAFAAAFGGP